MSVEDSESRRFELNIRMSFFEADLNPASPPELFFSGFSKSLELSVLRIVLIASCTRNILSGIFGIRTFYGDLCVSICMGLPT